MGSYISGIVFKSELKQNQIIDLLAQWTESRCELIIGKIEPENKKYSEAGDDIAVGFGKNQLVYLPSNQFDLVGSAMTEHALWENRLKESSILDWFLVFVRCDSGEFNGYALYDKGNFVRATYTTFDSPVFDGQAQDFEEEWLNASVYYEYTYKDKSGNWHDIDVDKIPEGIEDWDNYKGTDVIEDYHKMLYVGSKDNSTSADYLPLYLASLASEKYVGFDLVDDDGYTTFVDSLEFIYLKDNSIIKVEETHKLPTSEPETPWWKFWKVF